MHSTHSPHLIAHPPFSLAVYCGSRLGVEPKWNALAAEVGSEIGQRGWRLVYGGGQRGLMGSIASATRQAGGEVLGIIPKKLLTSEGGSSYCNQLVLVDSMPERKKQIADAADAFLALPGGIGTLDEFLEMWVQRQLGFHHKKLALLNAHGFFDNLLAWVASSEAAGFMDASQRALMLIDANPAVLLAQIANAELPKK